MDSSHFFIYFIGAEANGEDDDNQDDVVRVTIEEVPSLVGGYRGRGGCQKERRNT